MNVISLHSQTWRSLQSRRERLPHALLLLGQRGIGKYRLAHEFAASLLCEHPSPEGEACQQCLACHWFAQGNHPDFRLLQPSAMNDDSDAEESKKKSQQITIDQLRELDEFFNVGTHRGGLRIVLVNPTEAMNRNAANALLKTLEEPADKTLFLMVSSEPNRLLPTIRSRCQVQLVGVPASRQAEQYLADTGISDGARWLALAGGAPLLATEMAQSGQGGWLQVMTERLALGQRCDPLRLAGDMDKLIKESKTGISLKQVVDALQKWLIDMNLAKQGLAVRYFLNWQPTISELTDMIPHVHLLHAYRALGSRRQEAEQPLNARLFLESLYLDYRALFAS